MRTTCPHCRASLLDGQERLELGHEMRGIYDGVLFWSCPQCGLAWSRFGAEHHLASTAQKWVKLYNESLQNSQVVR